MVVLALDTTTREGGVALARDGAIVGTFAGDASVTHGERLPGDLLRLLSTHALRLADVDLFAIAAGPGSFTGLRIGIATLQGLALANNRPLVGVSALDAWNHAARSSLTPHPSPLTPHPSPLTAREGGTEVAIWMDAQRGEVFSALYAHDQAIDGPTVEKPAVVLARWAGRHAPVIFAGEGALAYEHLIRDAFPTATIGVELSPLAASVASLGEAFTRLHGPAAPDAIRPIYIRRSDAELARDRAVGLQPS